MSSTSYASRPYSPASHARQDTKVRQSGFTLVEVLVAMALGLLVALAALSALAIARRGFSSIDASSQLRDNSRYTQDLIQRVVVQTGFKDFQFATKNPSQADIAANIAPSILGFNNATPVSTDPINAATARTSDDGGNGSDVLILGYQGLAIYPGSATADGSIIDCAGDPVTAVPSTRNERVASIFSVKISDGEPTLMCTVVSSTGAISLPQPIVTGVETFQVLYGVDGFDTVNTQFAGPTDTVPDRYLRADQMVVGGNTASAGTYSNWRRVRSVRIGMVLRGPLGSQQEQVAQTFYPFGVAKSSSGGGIGSAFASGSDLGTILASSADGRLRQTVTFTVQLRQDQGL